MILPYLTYLNKLKNMNKESIILLGHGSRRNEANEILKTMTKIIQPKFPAEKIEFAFLS